MKNAFPKNSKICQYDDKICFVLINAKERYVSKVQGKASTLDKMNNTGVACGAGTTYPSGAPAFTPGFSVVRVATALVFV